MLPRHSGGPCMQETASECGSTLEEMVRLSPFLENGVGESRVLDGTGWDRW